MVNDQFCRAKVKDRAKLLRQTGKRKNSNPALKEINGIIETLWPIFETSERMRGVFSDRPIVSYRRAKNLKDSLVRSKVKRDRDVSIGMSKCSKKRCQICNYVEEGKEFFEEEVKYYINYNFDCDSALVIYLIYCGYSTITSFRKRFNSHKSSMNRHGRGETGRAGEHLYAHFINQGHNGMQDVKVKIIDKTNVACPTRRERFWAYKLNSFNHMG